MNPNIIAILLVLTIIYIASILFYFIPQFRYNRKMSLACLSSGCSHKQCGFFIEGHAGAPDRCFWGTMTEMYFKSDNLKCDLSMTRVGKDIDQHLRLRMSLETRNRYLFYIFVVVTIAVLSLGFQLIQARNNAYKDSPVIKYVTIEYRNDTKYNYLE